VVKEASGTPISHHRMKDLAIESAVAKNKQAELGVARVKRVDGTIQDERSYEKRPSPPERVRHGPRNLASMATSAQCSSGLVSVSYFVLEIC